MGPFHFYRAGLEKSPVKFPAFSTVHYLFPRVGSCPEFMVLESFRSRLVHASPSLGIIFDKRDAIVSDRIYISHDFVRDLRIFLALTGARFMATEPCHLYIDTDLGQYDAMRWVLMVGSASAVCSSNRLSANKA